MRLREIDKTRYRKHLRVVFAGIAVSLMIIAVGSSTLFIYLFSNPEVSHFSHNLAGVAVAAVIVVIVLNKFRQHPYMFEAIAYHGSCAAIGDSDSVILNLKGLNY